MVRPLGVILAGGLARRMGGGDKSLLSLGASSRVLDQVIARLGAQVDQMVLNANGDPARFDEFGLPVVADSLDGFLGPLAGVLTGLDYAAEHGFDHIVSVAADTPFFPTDLVSALDTASQHMDVPLGLAATKIAGGKLCVTQRLGCGPSSCAKICDPPYRMDCARLFCGRINTVQKLMSLTAVKLTRFLTSTHQKIWSSRIK